MRVLVINSDSMGRGDVELGQKLIGSFLRKLWARGDGPDAIVFYNSGVKLLARGSTVLDALEGLANAGVDLLACGTCVSFFSLKDSLAVGRVSDMGEIAELLMTADQTVTL
ncbi:MAG: sulfurtransferase-like selenium metabolism protein YedF [Acidobacteria bacterium]|nr:MAG: sulfurtransferase-like selenium metabolism protein YedF [Acidobacteriota bacterium]